MDKIPEHRTQNFKAKSAFKPEELRRNRNEQNVELRKQKREENLSKRRNLAIAAESEESEDEGVAAANSQVIERKSQRKSQAEELNQSMAHGPAGHCQEPITQKTPMLP